MQQTTVNEELEICYPDSFAIMSEDELREAYGMDYADMWGIRDAENHALFTIIWKESFDLAPKLISTKSLIKRVESKLKKAFRKQGYACSGYFKRELAGQEAEGFGYSYQVQGITQTCEAIVVRRGKSCYTLYYYTRPECAQANRAAYDEMLSSIRLLP